MTDTPSSLSFRPMPRDWLLRSKVADLLHLLEFSSISTATGGDDEQARKVMADLKGMLADAASSAQPGEPLTDKDFLGNPAFVAHMLRQRVQAGPCNADGTYTVGNTRPDPLCRAAADLIDRLDHGR
jgi:hypothetical protein